MNRFVIKPPKAGRTTVQLVTHRYRTRQQALEEGGERGTQTVYLGSFSSSIPPHELDSVAGVKPGDASSGIALRPGVFVGGLSFELNAQDIAQIRAWLEEHGDYTKRQRQQLTLDAERAAAQQAERVALELELRTKVRADLQQELAEKMASRSAVETVKAAIEALDRACTAIRVEAENLHQAGHRPRLRRTKQDEDATAAEQLLSTTWDMRREAFGRFEAACKAAGLMSKKSRRRAASN
jgi:hypothetical protein